MSTRPTMQRLNELLAISPQSGQIKWIRSAGRAKAGAKAGRITKRGYHEVGIDGRLYFGHSLIFFAAHGWWPDRVDHINGDKLDNRIENLRCVDAATNARNRAFNSSPRGLLGAFRLANGRWKSSITADGFAYQLGVFDSAREAHEAYVAARFACVEAEKRARRAVLVSLASPAARQHLTVLEQLQADNQRAA